MPENISFATAQILALTAPPDKVVAAGNLLIVSSGGSITAYSALQQSGYSQLWQFTINASNTYGDLAVGHGRVFVCTGTNGNNVSSSIPAPVGASRISPSGGNTQLSPDAQALVVLDLATGAVCDDWNTASSIQCKSGTYIVPANVVVSGEQLVFSDQLGTVYGLSARNGRLYWFCTAPGSASPQSRIALGKDAAFFINYSDGMLYAVNFASQALRWSYTPPTGREFSYLEPVVSASAVMVSYADGSVQALDIGDATVLYDTSNITGLPQSQTWNLPAIDQQNDLAIFSSQQYLAALQLSTGNLLCSTAYPSSWPTTTTYTTALVYRDRIAALELIQNRKDFLVFVTAANGNIYVANLTQDLHNPSSPVFSLTPLNEQCSNSGLGTVVTEDVALGTGTIIIPSSTGIATVAFGDTQVCSLQSDTTVSFTLPGSAAITPFSIEAWVQTLTGGYLVSQEIASGQPGFQLEICNSHDPSTQVKAGDGRIRLVISDDVNVQAVQSVPTTVCDGHWHHIAAVRGEMGMTVYLDGQALSCDKWSSAAMPFDSPIVLSGSTQLNIGSPASTQSDVSPAQFTGLLAEIRLWSTTLTASQIQDRIGIALTGQEHGLLALLQVTGDQTLTECVSGCLLNTSNLGFTLSDLSLNTSLFPFLVHSAASDWPYAQTWVLEGQTIAVGPASGNGETIGLSCGDVFYAVNEVRGNRLWSWEAANAKTTLTSGPVDDKSFYLPEFQAGVAGYVLHALNINDGQLRWDYQTDATPVAIPPSPSLGNGLVLISPDCATITAVDQQLGTKTWSFAPGQTLVSELTVVHDQLFAIAGNTLYAVPLGQTGTVTATTAGVLSATLSSSPATAMIAGDGGMIFVATGTSVIALVANTLQPFANSVWNPDLGTLTGGTVISGMTASAKYNRIYLNLSSGGLLALDFSSGRQVFSVQPSNTSYFFTGPAAGFLYCTTANGIVVYDAQDGSCVGNYDAGTAPVAAPYVNNGTAVFPCEDKRMHSVVFGSDFGLLLTSGSPAISFPDQGKISVSDPQQFSAEAWFNTTNGGEIIAFTDSGAAFQFSLTILPTGILQANLSSSAYSVTAQASSSLLLDGDWHHVALIVKKGDGTSTSTVAILTLDGKVMDNITNLPLEASASFPAAGILLIGGNGTTTAYLGLLKELRLWNESLLEAELNARLHVQLRGNEPNLIACWDMDARSIFDSGPNALSDKTATGLSFWLCSLHLVKPMYPYLTGNIVAQNVVTTTASTGTQITSASYTSTIVVRNFDGSARPGTKVGIWSSAATTITLPAANVIPTGQSSALVTSTSGIEAVTDTNGELILQLACTNIPYSPELTIWADYMYPNEQLQLAAVPESQKHITLPPPQVTSTVKILADYNYAKGDGSANFVNTETSKTQVVITVSDYTHTPIPNTVLEVWSSDVLLVDYAGKPYSLSSQNGIKFTTDEHGSVVLTISKANSTLDCAKLIVHGLFQPRTDTFVIDPAEDAKKKLGVLSGSQLQGSTTIDPSDSTNNTFQGLDSQGNPILVNKKSTFLTSQQQGSANDLATSVNTLCGAAPVSTTGAPADSGVGFSNAPYPSGLGGPDSATVLPRKAGAFTRSAASIGGMQSPSFTLTINRDDNGNITGVTHSTDPATLMQAVQTVVARKAAQANRLGWSLGGFLSGVGHGIEHVGATIIHGVESIADKAAKLASEGIKDATQLLADGFDDVGLTQVGSLVITTEQTIVSATGEVIHHIAVDVTTVAGEVLNFVIKTVEDVVKALVQVFLAIEKFIEEVIAFLEALLDWEAILAVQRNLVSVLTQALSDVPNLNPTIVEAFTTLSTLTGFPPAPADMSAVPGLPGTTPSALAQAKGAYGSSKNQWIKSKASNGLTALTGTATTSVEAPDATEASIIETVESQLMAFIDDPAQLAGLDLQTFVTLINSIYTDIEADIPSYYQQLIQLVDDSLGSVSNSLSEGLDIPFLSDLYEFLTGDTLNWQDLIGLVLAIPVHVVFVFAGTAYVPLKCDLSLPGLPLSTALGDDGSEEGWVIAFAIFTIINGFANAADSYFEWQQVPGATIAPQKKFSGMFAGFTGVVRGVTVASIDRMLMGPVFSGLPVVSWYAIYVVGPAAMLLMSVGEAGKVKSSGVVRRSLVTTAKVVGGLACIIFDSLNFQKWNETNSEPGTVPIAPFAINTVARIVNNFRFMCSFLKYQVQSGNGGAPLPAGYRMFMRIAVATGIVEAEMEIVAYNLYEN